MEIQDCSLKDTTKQVTYFDKNLAEIQKKGNMPALLINIDLNVKYIILANRIQQHIKRRIPTITAFIKKFS